MWAVAARSIVPLLYIGLPSWYGIWLLVFFGLTQHAVLQEDVLDHRLNTRTVYMNPIFRFLYSNMNYHVEHHIFPTVPYHALPALHEEVKDQLAPALPSSIAAYREILTTLPRQAKDPTYEIEDRGIPRANGGTTRRPDGGCLHLVRDPRRRTGRSRTRRPRRSGQVRRIDVADRSFALFRLDEDEYAPDRRCLHPTARPTWPRGW